MRLIDADELQAHRMYAEIPAVSGDIVPGFAIDEAPTIEAEPVVHSFWIGLALGPHPGIGHGICGNCHQRITLGDHKNRCPNCGAIMDLEVPADG